MGTYTEETVECRLCKVQTRMLGTKLCDRCYELESRIHGDKSLAIQIFADMLSKEESLKFLLQLCTVLGVSTAFAKKLIDTENLLQEAKEHLEYCGYGDSWERECAEELRKKLDNWNPTTEA